MVLEKKSLTDQDVNRERLLLIKTMLTYRKMSIVYQSFFKTAQNPFLQKYHVTPQAPSSNSGNGSADVAARSSLKDVQSPTTDGFSSRDVKPGGNPVLINQTSVLPPTISINQDTILIF